MNHTYTGVDTNLRSAIGYLELAIKRLSKSLNEADKKYIEDCLKAHQEKIANVDWSDKE